VIEVHSGPLRFVPDDVEGPPTTTISGQLLSGTVTIGDPVTISPINQTARITAVEHPADAPADFMILSLDRDVQLSANVLISHSHDLPVETDVFLVEFSSTPNPSLSIGQFVQARIATRLATVCVQSVEMDGDNKAPASAIFTAGELLVIDTYARNPATGTVELLVDGAEIAKGHISMKGYADQRDLVTARATNITRVDHRITADHRTLRHGHHGAVIWLTGLSGSGKSTLAVELEKELFNRRYQVYVLDGDNVRHGLNANLGFSPEDRSENIRRVGEVAALFSRAGLIAVSAFISPYRSDRDRARAAVGDAAFHEIYVSADVSVCEKRDPKGLYKRARAGEIADFTGISAPYEAPKSPDLVVDTANLGIAESVALIVDYVERVTGQQPN